MAADTARLPVSAGCPAEIAALDLTKPGMLEASAGTGKTYALEHLVLRLLIETPDLELPAILVLTFTEKATGELREKIRDRILARLAEGGLPATVRERLQRAVLEFDRAAIHTIHGFCQRVLRKYAFENRTLFNLELLKDRNEALEQALFEQMRTTWLAGGADGAEAFRQRLSALKLGESKKWKEDLLALARDFNPERGDRMLPEFDPRAIARGEAEMAAALEAAAGLVPGLAAGGEDMHPWLGRYRDLFRAGLTLRKKGPEILRTAFGELSRLPTEAAARAAAGFDLLEAVKKTGLSAFKSDGFAALSPPPDAPPWPELPPFLAALDRMRAAAQAIADERDKLRFAPKRQVVLDLYARTRAWLREQGLITYDSMIENLALALREGRERVELLRREYRFCLVDEFQDTDPLQWEIFRTVFLSDGGGRPLFLIGDPKQAIYRFRGGDVYTYMEARKEMFALSRRGLAQGLGLGTNYRSTAGMVAAYNAAFLHPDWFHLRAADPADVAWRLPAEPDPLGYAPVAHGGLDIQRTWDETEAPRPIILKDFSRAPDKGAARRRLAGWIAAEMHALMAAPERLRVPQKTGGPRPLRWGDICLLVRTSNEGRYLERMLTEAGIPVQSNRRTGLWQSDAAAQYLAILESLDDPADRGKHARALLTRFFRTEGDAPPARPPASPHPLFEAWLRLAGRRRWARLFHSLQFRSGLVYREALRQGSDRSLVDFAHIGQELVREALKGNLALGGVVQRLRDRRAESPKGNEDAHLHREASAGGKVNLMTMHVSKGLEFPVVFLAGWSGSPRDKYLKYRDGAGTFFNLDMADADAKDLATQQNAGEERRLFYVAATRARGKMYLPLMPAKAGNSDYGPMGGFVAEAFRAAAAARPDLYHFAEPEDFALPAVPSVPPAHPEPAAAVAPQSPAILAAPDFRGYPTDDPLADAAPGRRRRRLTSYSHLVRGGPVLSADAVEGRYDKEEAPAEPAAAESLAVAASAPPGNALPRGKEVGNMFHAILEDIDFRAAADAADADAFLTDAAVKDRIESRMAEHQVGAEWVRGVAEVVWNTLRAELPDPAGGPPFRLADVDQRKPELEFLFPFPARPGPAGPDGYLWGFIDLVFRHRGRYYLLDWKSNHLAAYGAPDLERSMRESRYDAQYRLYSLALDKWLGALLPGYRTETHFGGVFYLYLRGLKAGSGDGIFALRPGAQDLRGEYAESLAALLDGVGVGARGTTGRLDTTLFFAAADAGAAQ